MQTMIALHLPAEQKAMLFSTVTIGHVIIVMLDIMNAEQVCRR